MIDEILRWSLLVLLLGVFGLLALAAFYEWWEQRGAPKKRKDWRLSDVRRPVNRVNKQ